MLRFEQVHKTYARQLGQPAHVALKGVDFEMQPGETLGLIGPNGAGKSTCIRLLLDFIRPDRGTIRIFGQPPQTPDIRHRIGYLPEIANFPQNVSCMEMVRFAGQTCRMSRNEIATAADKWLTRLGLWPERNRLLRGFSKGMQQRASFALALIHDPELLILDEPMSGLDPLGRVDIVNLIRELRQAGKSVLFCSHLLDDIERIAEKVLVLNRGNVLFQGPIPELRQHENEPLETAFMRLIRGDM
ncbi:MAG TPA: ABC transporter ATP-binding protein [Mariprofundaceae bacterium]|nr:ABC transporter ATP-binding protein [Mariprofundaceae bacterium]